MTVQPGRWSIPICTATIAAQVVALLAAGQAAAEHQVVDVLGVQLGDLGERGLDDRGGQVVRAQVLQGALEGPADGRAGGRDDHGFGHHGSMRARRVALDCYWEVTRTYR